MPFLPCTAMKSFNSPCQIRVAKRLFVVELVIVLCYTPSGFEYNNNSAATFKLTGSLTESFLCIKPSGGCCSISGLWENIIFPCASHSGQFLLPHAFWPYSCTDTVPEVSKPAKGESFLASTNKWRSGALPLPVSSVKTVKLAVLCDVLMCYWYFFML